MSFVYGVVCETCKNVDAVNAREYMAEDKLPRNGWISISFWEGEEDGVAGPEYHLCSPKCLIEFSKNVTQETIPSENTSHNHPHPH